MSTPSSACIRWVRQHIPNHIEVVKLAGDASFRQFYRVVSPKDTAILMISPPENEDNSRFLYMQRLFAAAGIHVPRVLARHDSAGWFILTDLGDALLYRIINDDNVDTFYQKALHELLRLQRVSLMACPPPAQFDFQEIMREAHRTETWFLQGLLGKNLTPAERNLLEATQALLWQNVRSQPQVCMHRDFHARNLLWLAMHDTESRVAVIDFQDATLGPITYDVVSLLRDCYLKWPATRIQEWLHFYYEQARAHDLLAHDWQTVQQWFCLMGVQRHWKCLGIFARLASRDGKRQYLQDIPRTFQHLLEETAESAALAEFHAWLNHLTPALATVCE